MRNESTPGARGPVFCGVDTHADSHWLWIGNTYLDDSGRDSPASLNSTGDM